MVYKSGQIFSTVLSQYTRVTDGRTDRRTDRILITIPRLHYMQRGKKKKESLWVKLMAFPTNVWQHKYIKELQYSSSTY